MTTDERTDGHSDEHSDEQDAGAAIAQLGDNLVRIEALSARLIAAMSHRPGASAGAPVKPGAPLPGQEVFQRATQAWMTQMMEDPSKLWQQQVTFWSDTLRHAAETPEQGVDDRRFQDEAWENTPYFKLIMAQYKAAQDAMENALDQLDGIAQADKARLEYFSRSILDMYAPGNFLATNPQAITRAVETEGQSLIDGLENMVRDLEAHDGQLLVSLCDPDAFEVGKNLAMSKGSVVFRNDLLELIQYEPRTEKVHKTPVVLFPPWINKFYILDLKEKNSLVKWITEQGFTLFVVSWVNPDARHSDFGVDTYVEQGFLAAIEQVKQICNVKKVNTIGYCIGGTTLALSLAVLQKRGDESVNSATFFTTLTDFSNPGEVGVFLGDDFMDGIEAEARDKGYLDAVHMSRTFSFLRANDLVYGPAIKSYLLGETPPAFDLLFWNGDSTNLPARMAIEYLRGLCQRNEFATSGFSLLGQDVTLADVQVPLCAIACETDHIAPWRSSYDGIRAMGTKVGTKVGSSDKKFILSQSGHIAGIVNPPSKLKYGHYTGEEWPETAEKWLKSASFNKGSWWENWGEWLAERSGTKIAARQIPPKTALAPAPGTYVAAKPEK